MNPFECGLATGLHIFF